MGAAQGYPRPEAGSVSGFDTADHSTVHAGLHWLLLHDIHVAA